MHVAVILIERQRQRQFIDHSARRSLSVGAPVMDERLSENASLPRVRELDCFCAKLFPLEENLHAHT